MPIIMVIIGAVIGGLFEFVYQLIQSKGDLSQINLAKIGVAIAVGGITAACGPIVGALITGVGNVAMEMLGGTTDIWKLSASFGVGVLASFIGFGIGKAVTKIGGKIKINKLSLKSSNSIKKTILRTIEVSGRDRNSIKNIVWAKTNYGLLSDELIGKNIPQAFNSTFVGISSYGAMGLIYE